MTKTRHILALICALLMLSCSAAFAAPQQQEAPRPTLSVDGQGTGTATPDMATVTIGVTTQGEDAAKAQNDNAWVSNQIQSAVRSLGIEDKDIQTNGFNLNPSHDRNGQPNGYEVMNMLRVRIRDLSKVGAVMDAAIAAGANQIYGVQFTL